MLASNRCVRESASRPGCIHGRSETGCSAAPSAPDCRIAPSIAGASKAIIRVNLKLPDHSSGANARLAMVRSEAIRHQDMPEMHVNHKQIDMDAQEPDTKNDK